MPSNVKSETLIGLMFKIILVLATCVGTYVYASVGSVKVSTVSSIVKASQTQTLEEIHASLAEMNASNAALTMKVDLLEKQVVALQQAMQDTGHPVWNDRSQ